MNSDCVSFESFHKQKLLPMTTMELQRYTQSLVTMDVKFTLIPFPDDREDVAVIDFIMLRNKTVRYFQAAAVGCLCFTESTTVHLCAFRNAPTLNMPQQGFI